MRTTHISNRASATISFVRFALSMLATCVLPAETHGQQWTVVNLHPASLFSSQGVGVDGEQQGGTGGIWMGSAESYVSLGPTALVNGVGSGQQAGRFVSGVAEHACVWSGTAESRIDLHPAGALFSTAYGTHGELQAGYIATAPIGVPHAVLWRGSAASLVDLHPVGSIFSQAYAIHGDQQVGQAQFSTGVPIRAALWRGTAQSFVDLHPAVGSMSFARGTDGIHQVGDVHVGADGNGTISHAALWSGTSASFIDLNPAGARGSIARGVSAGEQVGAVFADFVGPGRATLWSGSASSAIDLHAYLPANFSSSFATGISHTAQRTYVIGTGHNDTTDRYEALLWIRCGPLVGDLDSDQIIGIADLALLLSSYGCASPSDCGADLDGDGIVGLSDLSLLLSNFGQACP